MMVQVDIDSETLVISEIEIATAFGDLPAGFIAAASTMVDTATCESFVKAYSKFSANFEVYDTEYEMDTCQGINDYAGFDDMVCESEEGGPYTAENLCSPP